MPELESTQKQAMQEDKVRVAVRVRPLLPKERLAGEHSCVKIHASTSQLVLGKDKAFTFDNVLMSKSSQEEVYQRCVESLVKSCFEGYNATVFAYGQTGSGKTYTVGGGNITSQTEDEFGIIPRAVKTMFDCIKVQPNREYCIKVSYIEIYKEEVRDLLDLETSSKDMHIREDEQGHTLISGISELECSCMEEVMSHLEQGSSYRHTGSTQMNEQSSRSHSIFTMYIEQSWSDSVEGGAESKRPRLRSDDSELILDEATDIEHYMSAKFHFVDLAGSERAHRTGNVGDRFKESVHINSGLLALGNVISALGDPKKKVTHIPYRDSKITRLLKDSLGGNSKTLMICCISPSSANFDESLNALKYANRARNIRNKPIVNRDPQSIRFEEMQSEIKALREELQRQRTSVVPGTANDLDLQRAIQDAGQVKSLEDKVVRLQTETAHYRMIAEEAYKQLMEIQKRDVLSQSLNVRLSDWMELMEEIKNKVPATLNKDAWENQAISRLKDELKQCKNDLKSDEEIFAEKAREVGHLQNRVNELEESQAETARQLQEAEERLQRQQEQLVAGQVHQQELELQLKEAEERTCVGESLELQSGPPTTTRRAKSVPAQMVGERTLQAEVSARNIHTSPAVFSLERVMQGFRARSQLLVSRLEDSDDVLRPHFSEEEGEEQDPDADDVFDDVTDAKDAKGDKDKDRSQFRRNARERSTYKVRRPKMPRTSLSQDDENVLRKSQTDDEKLNSMKSAGQRLKKTKTFNKSQGDAAAVRTSEVSVMKAASEVRKKKLKQTELEVRQSAQKMRDLSINIRMKEQLIKELVKTGKDAEMMNRQYENRLEEMEKEKRSLREEFASLQGALQEVEQKEAEDKAEKDRLQCDFRKKMELARSRINALQRKQKETEKMAAITGQTDRRIQELELAVDKMRQQQELLQRRLKDEMDRKAKLEREMQKEHQKMSELEIRNEQQQKVLKVKTEEVTAMHRRLRTGSSTVLSDEQTRLDEQKRWLDSEMEKVLEQRQNMEELQRDLDRREDIVAKKEALLAERSELEIKKLRSSQVLNKDIVVVSSRLETIERKLEEKTREIATTPRQQQSQVREELARLQQGRDKLRKQRAVLDGKLDEGTLLSPQEERRLIELEEAIETMDSAIEYKNEAIFSKQEELRRSTILTQSEDHFVSRLASLSLTETKTLLAKYFEKVIDLRDCDRKKERMNKSLEMRVDEQHHVIQDMQANLQRAAMETDRRLTQQQHEYERKIQVLMQQLTELQPEADAANNDNQTSAAVEREREAKVQQLERDLYYYKKTSRDLKKKLRELLAEQLATNGSSGGESAERVLWAPTPRDVEMRNRTPRDPETAHRTPRDPETAHRTPRDPETAHRTPRDPETAHRTPRDPETAHRTPRDPETAHRTPRDPETAHRTPRDSDATSRTGSGQARPESHNGVNNESVALSGRLPAPPSSSGGSNTPVRLSRRDLRRMSEEEVKLRKSAKDKPETPRDSLET